MLFRVIVRLPACLLVTYSGSPAAVGTCACVHRFLHAVVFVLLFCWVFAAAAIVVTCMGDVFYLTHTQGLSYEMANLSVRRGSVQPPVAVVSPQPGVRRGSTGSASINGRVYTNTGAGVGPLDDDGIVSLEDSPWWVATNERLRMLASRGSDGCVRC